MTTSFDVIVIGGGALGASCARELAREGRRVLVLEPGGSRGQAWQAAAGMLAPQIETDYFEPLYELGVAGRERYETLSRELAETTGMDIGLWHEGIARVATDEAEAAVLRDNVSYQRQQGHRCDWLDAEEVRERWPWVGPVLGALWAPHDGALDPRRLVEALLADAVRLGATVVPAAATAIVRSGDRVTGVVAGETWAAGEVIVAAGAWAGRIEGLPRPLSVEPVRGQMAAVAWPAGLRRGILYHGDCYILARGEEALFGSTMEYAGFDASVTEAGQRRIREGVRTLSPDFAAPPPVRTWAGLRPVTPDGLPILGPAPDVGHLWYACGHGRNGILLAGISAVLLHQMIKGEPVHEHVKAFSPSRMWQW